MERQFDNLEEAELFAAHMRSEGHEAEVLSESIPTLWGAAAMGDIRVIVHDSTGGEAEATTPSPTADLAGRLFYGALMLLFLVAGGWLALELTAYLLKGGLLDAALKLLAALCTLYALSAWALLLSSLFRKRRDTNSRLGLVVHALVSIVAAVLSIILLVVDLGLY